MGLWEWRKKMACPRPVSITNVSERTQIDFYQLPVSDLSFCKQKPSSQTNKESREMCMQWWQVLLLSWREKDSKGGKENFKEKGRTQSRWHSMASCLRKGLDSWKGNPVFVWDSYWCHVSAPVSKRTSSEINRPLARDVCGKSVARLPLHRRKKKHQEWQTNCWQKQLRAKDARQQACQGWKQPQNPKRGGTGLMSFIL